MRISEAAKAPGAPRGPAPASEALRGPLNEKRALWGGETGPDVEALQAALIERGQLAPPATGAFDAATKDAVRRFQSANGLLVDGIVGQQTWGAFIGEVHPPGVWLLETASTPGFSDASTFESAPTSPAAPPADAAPTDRGAKVVALAAGEVGYAEHGVNENKFSAHFGRGPEAWCADFVSWAYSQAGTPLNVAYVPTLEQTLRDQGRWTVDKQRQFPKAGDIITFTWNGESGANPHDGRTGADHVGLVERVFMKQGELWVSTIEGNSADQVRRQEYAWSDPRVRGAGSPP